MDSFEKPFPGILFTVNFAYRVINSLFYKRIILFKEFQSCFFDRNKVFYMTPSHAVAVVIPECGINFVKNLSHKILGAFGIFRFELIFVAYYNDDIILFYSGEHVPQQSFRRVAFGGVNMNFSARYVVYRVVIRNVGYFIIVNRLFAYKRRSAMRTYRGIFDGSISSTPPQLGHLAGTNGINFFLLGSYKYKPSPRQRHLT